MEATVVGLDPDDFDIHVCAFAPSARLDRLAAKGHGRVFPLRRIYGPDGVTQMLQFRQYLRSNRIAVVHSWMGGSTMFSVAAAIGSGLPLGPSGLT